MHVSKAFQNKAELMGMALNKCDICSVCLHLNIWGCQRFPVVGFQLVELIKLQANIFDWQLEHIPETCQVLGDGPWVCIGVLKHKDCTHAHLKTYVQKILFAYLTHIFRKDALWWFTTAAALITELVSFSWGAIYWKFLCFFITYNMLQIVSRMWLLYHGSTVIKINNT